MKTFGENCIEWEGPCVSSPTGRANHVIVATRGSAWEGLCHATPDKYVDIVGAAEVPSAEAVVWKHDRSKIDCPGCLAVLDGAVVVKTPLVLR